MGRFIFIQYQKIFISSDEKVSGNAFAKLQDMVIIFVYAYIWQRSIHCHFFNDRSYAIRYFFSRSNRDSKLDMQFISDLQKDEF